MAKVRCPNCGRTVGGDDINVAADVAMCRACGEAFKLSDAVDSQTPDVFDVATPPRGAWFEKSHNGFHLGASTRSIYALFIVPFAALWVGGSLSALYGSQIFGGEFDPIRTLIGIPFVVASIALISVASMMLCGKITVTVQNNLGYVFTGVGPFGWKRRFRWDDMKTISEGPGIFGMRSNYGNRLAVILMEGKTRLAFGSLLSEEKSYFVLQALRKMRITR